MAACCNLCKVRSMPRCSSGSAVSRIPAVSINLKVIPWILIVSSIKSRVVPAISETRARSSFKRAFNSVDFPTLGLPTIATGTPFLRILPSWKELLNVSILCWISSSMALRRLRSANSTSSSLKSNSNSRRDTSSSNWARNRANSSEYPPRICREANMREALLSEAIISATASACDRSIFPAIYALSVNSPPWAIRAPFWINSRKISCWMYVEPWQVTSIISSPV